MPTIAHVYRRRAVYQWRRRLPFLLDKGQGGHVALSLRTTNQVFARTIGARLDEEFSRMFEQMQGSTSGDHRLTRDQIKAMFAEVAMSHLAKLERVAAYDRLQPSFDIDDSRDTDRTMGNVFRLLATGGADVKMNNATIARLEASGLSDADIDRVATQLIMLRNGNGHVDHRARLERLLDLVGAPSTPVNLQIAQRTKHRAMAAALLDTRDRWDHPIGNDEVLLNALVRQEAGRLPDQRAASTSSEDILQAQPSNAEQKTPAMPADGVTVNGASMPNGDIEEVVKLLVEGAMRNAEEKTKRQVTYAATFFGKYLREICGVVDLRHLKQPHIAGFAKFLQNEVYLHHGKGGDAEKKRTIAELRVIWSKKPKHLIGVDKPTMERWAGQLTQTFTAARAAGVAIDPTLSWKGLIANAGRKDRARNARPTASVAQSISLFHQPPFTGCAAWNAMGKVGDLIFHCALYFVPMLVTYGGGRREEFCGALLSDVITDNGPIPYIWIEKNEYRGIKNPQSRRPIVLHPELIRLGFLDYVALMISLGYELLFHDLYSPTSSSPLGDRLGDDLRPILDAAGILERGTGVHSSRRGFGNNLKQERVDAEMRAELLGHGGDTETTERYCDAYELGILYTEVLKLPVVTSHLQPAPIRLLPWVAAKERPPFSHPSRAKRRKPT